MSGSVVVLACLWVLAATGVAFLPRRWQYAPGLALLAAAVWLMWALAGEYGAWVVLPLVLAVVSMFRWPLAVLLRRLGPGRRVRQGKGME